MLTRMTMAEDCQKIKPFGSRLSCQFCSGALQNLLAEKIAIKKHFYLEFRRIHHLEASLPDDVYFVSCPCISQIPRAESILDFTSNHTSAGTDLDGMSVCRKIIRWIHHAHSFTINRSEIGMLSQIFGV
jgi:hypothetical protein